jgi:hypothetical protein
MLGPPTWWWGAVLLALAGVTALVTVFYALLSKDLKTALAYHSVENVGIILAGGPRTAAQRRALSAAPRPSEAPAASRCWPPCTTPSTMPCSRRRCFWGLAASRDRPVRSTPQSSVGCCALALDRRHVPGGAVAIVGLPPLNGFISEWLTPQSLLGSQGGVPGPLPQWRSSRWQRSRSP